MERGWSVSVGDATHDATLRALGIDRARGLAAVLTSDADNLFVVLSARLLNPDLPDLLILARATEEESVDKMERAGADQVVNVHQIGANQILQVLRSPSP